MSTSTQKKFFDVLVGLTDEADIDLVVNARWGNDGEFRLEPRDGFVAELTVGYSFQDGYSSFHSVKPPIADSDDGKKWDYVLHDEIGTRVLDRIRDFLMNGA